MLGFSREGIAPDKSGVHAKGVALRWMYLLVLIPVVTDLIENDHFPRSLREWVTEVVVGVVIALLVHRVRQEHSSVLALARSDALTGLPNRRAFEENIEAYCVRARRSGQPLTLVCIDLDNFKRVNDEAGHAVGDRVLVQLASAMRSEIRARVDNAYRMGGDEFALLIPGVPASQAQVVVDRIAAHCVQADPIWEQGTLGISAGIVELETDETVPVFARRADAAMYRHKVSHR